MPAALLSVSVTRSLEPSADPSCLVSGPDAAVASPAEVARRLNTLYPMESNGKLYFTMIYGVLDLETGRFRFISAGHPGPILVRPGSPPEQIVVPSLVIGAFQDVNYSDSEVQLEAGDRLYLFSDGLYEETNDKDQQFQVSRLMNALATRVGDPLEASLEFVRQDLVAWHGTDDFTDDFSHPRLRDAGGGSGCQRELEFGPVRFQDWNSESRCCINRFGAIGLSPVPQASRRPLMPSSRKSACSRLLISIRPSNHFVCARQQGGRDLKSGARSCLEVDDQPHFSIGRKGIEAGFSPLMTRAASNPASRPPS